MPQKQAKESSISLHDLPSDNRPRERLLKFGPAALSTSELLAIILRTGTTEENVLRLSERILAQYEGLHGLAQASPGDLQRIKGLGDAKIAQIMAALEVGKRLMTQPAQERAIINHAADVARLMGDMSHLTQEHVRVILLDISRRVMSATTVYIGTLNASVLRISEIFRDAVTRNSPAIILVHNHPSGDPKPSPEDIEVTRAIVAAGKLLDILVMDHIIMGERSWVSLKEMGLGF
jgi:DNA repair protein RadC